jgi:glycerol-3-phosphate acyltransferase PlsX
MEWVKAGKLKGFVDCANTAVTHVASSRIIGELPGVNRAIIPVFLPRFRLVNGETEVSHTLLVDAGANAKVTDKMLGQFAVLGAGYYEAVTGSTDPRVGLLSNGSEPNKGTELVKAANKSMSEQFTHAEPRILNFIGNVEGRDIYNGNVDVVVTDGFTGNIVLKTSEGMSENMRLFLQDITNQNFMTKLSGRIIRRYLQKFHQEADSNYIGGVLHLGVNGVVIIGHGSSKSTAILNAIKQAQVAHDKEIISKLTQKLAQLK